MPASAPRRWLDLEVARRRAVAARGPTLAHDAVLFRQPVTTLDDHLARGLRVEALRDLVDGFEPRAADDDAVLAATDLVFGPPVLRPPSVRDFYAFEGHVRTMWERRGGEIPEAWYRLPVFYFSNVSEIRGPDEPVWSPAASHELDYELEVAALIDTPAVDLPPDRAEEAIGGFTIFDDWSARDLQREETAVRLGPAKGKDFASSFGPWLVTPDELADARRGTGYDLAMTAEVNGTETSRGRWSDAQFSFGDMLARASADVTAPTRRPGRQRHRRRPAACSRSATRRSGATSSPATRSSSASSVSARSAPPIVARPAGRVDDAMATTTIRADDGRRLARRPADLRRGDRDRRRDPRARGAGLGPFRPLAPGRRAPGRARRVGRHRSAGPPSAATRRARSTAASPGRASTSRRPPAAGASGGRCSRRSSRPRRRPGYWTLFAGVLAENASSLALHERVGFRRIGVQERMGQDARGRWRDVVLLERRSAVVGRD